jgi:hypothetical protein
MQVSQIKLHELTMLIAGLRSLWYPTEKEQQQQALLLMQLENLLRDRFGKVLNET